MSIKKHPLHKSVGRLLRGEFGRDAVKSDKACGGRQNIPLFYNTHGAANEFSDVDLLVLKKNKIKAIIEIEETAINPHKICGKFMSVVLTNKYIHKSKKTRCREEFKMGNPVLFLQIVKKSKLKTDAKYQQLENLERLINNIKSKPFARFKYKLMPIRAYDIKRANKKLTAKKIIRLIKKI